MNTDQKTTTVNDVEAAVRKMLLARNIDHRPKRTKVKSGTKLHFPLMDATAPEKEFERDKAECELVFVKVQKMLARRFPGCRAEREMGRAYPQSNTHFKITITWPPVFPAQPASPPRLAKNIDQWLLGRGNIDRQPGQPDLLPPTWHYISIDLKGKTHGPAWVVVGPKSKITKELLEQEIEITTGKKYEVVSINNYGSTYKPRTRWLIANGFLTDLTGKVAARQQEREQIAKQPPSRKRVVPSQEAVIIWLNGQLQSVNKKREEQEILPACWKRLRIDLHLVSNGKRTTVDWLVIEERPQPVKTYHDLILVDLQDLLGVEKLVIRHMAVAGKQYITAARSLLKHGFYTDVPMEEIERRKALDLLEKRRSF